MKTPWCAFFLLHGGILGGLVPSTMTQEEDFCPGKALTGRCISLSICYRIRAINEEFFPVRECEPSESTRRVCCALRPRERSSLAIAKRNLMDDMVKDCYKRWPPGKIVNGKELPNAFYYPFLGTLGKKRTPNIFDPNPYSFSCGATLLNREFALTAGHCFGPDLGNRFDIIRLREHNVKKNEPDLPPPVDIPIAEQIVHPDYHHPSHENDIALLRFATPLKRYDDKNNIQPACLPVPEPPLNTGKIATAVGWGHTSFGGRASPVPLHVNLTIQDAESCSEQYKKFPRTLPNGVTKDILCAGDRGKDTCQNDSGGPLLFDARQNLDGTLEREFVLVGVVSGGINCGDTPGIYTRVSSYTDWILETMLEKSQMNKDAV